MNNYGNQLRPAGAGSISSFSVSLTWLSAMFVLCLFGAMPSMAVEQPDDAYLRIYRLIEKADVLNESGRSDTAKARYQEAQTNLMGFKKTFPTWNTKLVSYRLNYLTEKIAALSQPPPTSAPAVAPAERTEPAPVTSPATQPATTQVKLLEAGAEPRRILRLHPKPGNEQTLVMAIKTAVNSGMGQTLVMPIIKLTLAATVKNVSADGNTAYELALADAAVLDEPEAMPELATMIKASLAAAKGLVIAGTLSNRGIPIGASESKMPPGANPQTRQFIDQMKEGISNLACLLPEEAIGPGAKWEVNLPFRSHGMTIQQTATYETVSIKDDHLQTKYSIAQKAANQKMESPAMPGLKVEVPQMTGTVAGTSALNLAQAFPSQATVDSHSELLMNMGTQKQAMTMKTDTNVRIEAK